MNGFGAIIASFGFGVLFNLKGRKLCVAALIGGLGGIVYQTFLNLGYTDAMGLFVASMSISIASEIFARMIKCPVTTFLICALIPLVPGGGMYYTMLEVVNNNIDAALIRGVATIVQAGSIVIGCTLVSSATRLMLRFRKGR